MVLLKNDGILPLKRSQKLAFIGKFAETPRFQGGGSSHVNSYKVTSALEAAKGLDVTYAPGYDTNTTESDEALLEEAQEAAKNADAAVVFVGITDAMESEGMDRRTLSMPENHERWLKVETAKRRLVAQLISLGLQVVPKSVDEEAGLAFDFVGVDLEGNAPTTGHANGLITLDIKEADDAHREKIRVQMREPYRTLLGHFRHEVGHYY